MKLKEHFDKAVEYVKQNVDEIDIMFAWKYIDKCRCPLRMAHANLANYITKMMDEYGQDNSLPEDWWLKFGDEEFVFEKL